MNFDPKELIQALNRNAEIIALTTALQLGSKKQHTCLSCGLYATLEPDAGAAWNKPDGHGYYYNSGPLMFCDQCAQMEKTNLVSYKPQGCNVTTPAVERPVVMAEHASTKVARRLNFLLRGE